MVSRRQFMIGGALLAASGIGRPGSVRAASASDLAAVQLRVAQYKAGDQTLLTAAGLDATPYKIAWSEFPSGTRMVEAINAGAIDLAYGSEIPTIFAALSEPRLRIVAVIRGDVNEQVILVPAGSAIQTIADLRGKRVGYVKATTTHYYLLRMLAEAGLGFDDISPINLSPADGYAAFASGALDAWAIYGYSVPLTIARTQARVLKTALGYLSGNYLYAAGLDALADPRKQAAIGDLLSRLQRAFIWQTAEPAAYAAAVAPLVGVPTEMIVSAQHGASQPRRLTPIDNDAIRRQQEVADQFAEAGLLPRRVDVTPLWDGRFNASLAKGSI
jgi:sulfonate transport system substrate-binding protein